MTDYIKLTNISVAKNLYDFMNQEALAGTDISCEQFFAALEDIVTRLTPINRSLLKKRIDLQTKIDEWHQNHKGDQFDFAIYKAFLSQIGYLVPEGEDFKISTSHVDPEINQISGPQLVVPINNPRYTINAVNARWNSLYDALYGTDVISQSLSSSKGFNQDRGKQVIAYVRRFLDQAAPLATGSHADAVSYVIKDGALKISLNNHVVTTLKSPEKLIGWQGNETDPSAILLKNNNLHIELHFDRNHLIGALDLTGISDIILESAITSIMDCEDSVAAVDAADKVDTWRNWLGLMKGTLSVEVSKGGKVFNRCFNQDRIWQTNTGKDLTLKGRVTMLIRNVGHLMTNSAVLLADGTEAPEGILDALVTGVIAIHDLKSRRNSQAGSVYVVKPKMHGPEEVAFANTIFTEIEKAFKLPAFTFKIGVMDEERRTSVNLKECIRQVKDRIVFINTGFLDRTGDEIHTSIHAGIFPRKEDLKNGSGRETKWLKAYEDRNVDIALACGFQGRAQIGKGMWAMPDLMSDMIAKKISHPQAGANTAWVPSPTAATLHAMHYHQINVKARQDELTDRPMANIDDILTIPLSNNPNWSHDEIQAEIDNNCQGILGYVVRWIDQGIGCSKVPDINQVGLMEDRATLRISSQHLGNWLLQGVCTLDQVMQSLKKMAIIVDKQNETDPLYVPMAKDFEHNIAFLAACDLIFEAQTAPNGYTEPALHKRRLEKKQLFASKPKRDI